MRVSLNPNRDFGESLFAAIFTINRTKVCDTYAKTGKTWCRFSILQRRMFIISCYFNFEQMEKGSFVLFGQRNSRISRCKLFKSHLILL